MPDAHISGTEVGAQAVSSRGEAEATAPVSMGIMRDPGQQRRRSGPWFPLRQTRLRLRQGATWY